MRTIEGLAMVTVLIAITGCDPGTTGATNGQVAGIQSSGSPTASPSPSPIVTATASPSPTPSPVISSSPVSAAQKSAFYQACSGSGFSAPGIDVTSTQFVFSGTTSVCEFQATLSPINTSVSTITVPLLGPDTAGGFSPLDTGISLWVGDTIQSISVSGQYSNQAGSSAFTGAGFCSGTVNDIAGNLYGETPGMNNPFLIGTADPTSVPSDGDLFIGVDSTSSEAACWENVSLSVQVLRCVDSSGNTYACSSTTTIAANENPPENFSFSITGQGGATPTYSTYTNNGSYINTDNLLQVQITAGGGGELTFPSTGSNEYSDYTASYNCITYTVSVYDSSGDLLQSQTTGTLAVTAGNTGCTSASTSQTLDFSSVVISGAHTGVYVTVSADQYDFYCEYWWSLYDVYGTASPWYADYSSFCPMREVYQTHTVNGSINVITNRAGD